MFSALPAASSARARSKAAIAPFMSTRRTTSASVIQRLTARSPPALSSRLRSCSFHGLSSRRGQESSSVAHYGKNTIAIKEIGKPCRGRSTLRTWRLWRRAWLWIWLWIWPSTCPSPFGPRGPIVPGARQRTGRQVDGGGEPGLARRQRTEAPERQRTHLVFGVLAHGD